MLNALRLKFADPILGQKLLDTGDEELIEGNHWCDNVWGNCYCEKCANITGQNRLGQMLMRVRDELRNN